MKINFLIYLLLAVAANASNASSAPKEALNFIQNDRFEMLVVKMSKVRTMFVSRGRGNETWLQIQPNAPATTAPCFIVGTTDGVYLPDKTKLVVTYEPHVKKLQNGKWEITFSP